MKKLIEKYYCDRCGIEMTKEMYEKSPFIDMGVPIHKICSTCYSSYTERKNNFINWLKKDGEAFAIKEVDD